jgi:hypothetical protein
MEQTIYLLIVQTYASLGNPPQLSLFVNQADAQALWDSNQQSEDWGTEVDWMQILTIPTTVIQATDGSPSGVVTLPADPGSGD